MPAWTGAMGLLTQLERRRSVDGRCAACAAFGLRRVRFGSAALRSDHQCLDDELNWSGAAKLTSRTSCRFVVLPSFVLCALVEGITCPELRDVETGTSFCGLQALIDLSTHCHCSDDGTGSPTPSDLVPAFSASYQSVVVGTRLNARMWNCDSVLSRGRAATQVPFAVIATTETVTSRARVPIRNNE